MQIEMLVFRGSQHSCGGGGKVTIYKLHGELIFMKHKLSHGLQWRLYGIWFYFINFQKFEDYSSVPDGPVPA